MQLNVWKGAIDKMTKNIMIVGVGGQGTLLTSRILGGLTMDAGHDVKVAKWLSAVESKPDHMMQKTELRDMLLKL